MSDNAQAMELSESQFAATNRSRESLGLRPLTRAEAGMPPPGWTPKATSNGTFAFEAPAVRVAVHGQTLQVALEAAWLVSRGMDR